MALDVNRHTEADWGKNSKEIGLQLSNLIDNAPVGQVMRSIVNEQVQYIKSLPSEAVNRVAYFHNKAMSAVSSGQRASEFTDEIYATGDVIKSRAKLIARTEIGRASTALTQTRALTVGSTGYIWRTAHDGDVRHSHQKMEGEFVRWDNPPTLDGMTGHAGALPNCRCYCEVVIPEN